MIKARLLLFDMSRPLCVALCFYVISLTACSSSYPLTERASQATLDCLEIQSDLHCNKAIEAAKNLSSVSDFGSSCATDAGWLQLTISKFLMEKNKLEARKEVLDAISSLKKTC